MNDLSETLERLSNRIETLEGRVSALEQTRLSSPSSAPAARKANSATAIAPGAARETGVFSVLGKAMLAIAGAYLLRALAESSALPRAPVVALGIVYAFFWLLPAARAKTRLPAVAWTCTSALILLPMLWELTLRFGFLTDAVAAAVLSAFVVTGSALAWKQNFAEVAWVAETASSLAAVALALAAHDLLPMLSALLVVAVVGEVAAARHRTLRVRPLAAAAADFLVFALIWIYSSPAASRAEYPILAPPLILAFAALLLLIYAAGASIQTLLLGRRISFFETAQTLVAFLLTVQGVMDFWSGPGARALGILCLAGAAGGYAITFARFEHASSPRNFHVYASGSLALLLAGCWLSLPTPWLSVILALLALAAALAGARTGRRTVQFHGLACLLGAAFCSGLLPWTLRVLAGPFPSPPGAIVSLVSVAAILGYAAVATAGRDSSWALPWLRLPYAALALAATTALLVWGLVILTAGSSPAAEHLALLRTGIGCSLTVLLAWAGSRRRRRELVWVAWASLASIAAKLLFEDLRHGHLGFTAASIFVYAITLLVVPRLARSRQDPTAQA